MKKLLMIIFTGLWLAVSAGSAFTASEKYGQPITDRQIQPIKNILASPKDFIGKVVTVEGKIAQECPTGCWFYLKVSNGNYSIYVDIGKSGFSIPQHSGKKILVQGTVEQKGTSPTITGKGVEIL